MYQIYFEQTVHHANHFTVVLLEQGGKPFRGVQVRIYIYPKVSDISGGPDNIYSPDNIYPCVSDDVTSLTASYS